MSAIIELVNIKTYFYVTKGFFKTLVVKAVDGVSLTIHKSETVALVGESGSGKTTLGRTALKLVDPTSGKIIFEGKDITHVKENLKEFRKKAQMVFQDPFMSLNPYMTIRQIIEEPMLVHGYPADEREKKLLKALSDVRLLPTEEFLPKYPHMLSGGQRQRVGIAKAIVLDPVFLVADEPVSMIDASSRAEILFLLRDLQKKYAMGIMYITHDIATANYFSDNIGVMYLGKIVEYGPTKEVIKNPLHPYTKALIEAVPDPDPGNRFKERNVIPGEPPSPINPPSGCRFNTRCPFVFGKCKEEPQLVDVGNKHMVACHLHY
ncbi:MAG: ABC transporter ATP-binding protein [Nitrososphaerota archaeon]|nr:ABC transporter ATP-binding protein [Candidatus Bathyarchaeota archaeon]MDW8023962.1 ABC transporter ATP-binding protein [Nitrososphaerota archaeon]